MHLVVYFDYTCPYSFTAAQWLQHVEGAEPNLTFEWRHFILKEANRSPDEGLPFWEQEGARQTRTGLAFIAGQAAARQGQDAFARFRLLLQEAFQVRHLDIRRAGVLESLAEGAGLDVARFETDRGDPGLLGEAGTSHLHGVERYQAFGTPTLVFPNDRAVYLKLTEPPSETMAMEVFETLRRLVEQHQVEEIKFTGQGRA